MLIVSPKIPSRELLFGKNIREGFLKEKVYGIISL